MRRWVVRWVTVLAMLTAGPAAMAQQPPTLDTARALYDAGQLDTARAQLIELARSQPGDAGVHLLLGVIERTQRRLPEAIASLERAHALSPGSTQVAVELATTLAWHRDLDRAIALYRQVLATEPAHVGARIGLAFALAWQGRLDQARALFRELIDSNPGSIDAWNGLGFVDRALLQYEDAAAEYGRALALDPGNADATAALKELHWDRRTDVRVFGGGSVVPDGSWEAEGRIDVTRAITPGLTIGGGYRRYAYGAVLPIGGVGSADTRTEDSLEATVVVRPSSRFTLGNSLYTFFSDDSQRGMVWMEGVFAVTPRLSLTGVFRPAFSSVEPKWLLAGAAGASIELTTGHRVSARALVGGDRRYEPQLTLLADYTATWSRRFQLQILLANSSSDPQFAFTSVGATARWLWTPAVGVSLIASHRTQTFERSELMIGVTLRR